MKNLYQILELDSNATTQQIKQQYRKLALLYHPDRCSGDEEKFKEINLAHEVLSDPKERDVYDVKQRNSYSRTADSLHKAEAAANSTPSAQKAKTFNKDEEIQHLYAEKCKYFREETQKVFDDLINESPLWRLFVIGLPEDAIEYVNNSHFIHLLPMMVFNKKSPDVESYLRQFNVMRKNIELEAWEYIARPGSGISRMRSFLHVQNNFRNVPLHVLKEVNWPEFYEISRMDPIYDSLDVNSALRSLRNFNQGTIPFIYSPASKMAISKRLFSFGQLLSMPENILRTMDQHYVETGLMFIEYFSESNKYASGSPISGLISFDRKNFVLSYILIRATDACWSYADKLIQIDRPYSNRDFNNIRMRQSLGLDAFIEWLLHLSKETPSMIQLKKQLEQEHQQLWESVDPLHAAKQYAINAQYFTHAALDAEPDQPILKLIILLIDKFEQILNEVEQKMLHDEPMNTIMRL